MKHRLQKLPPPIAKSLIIKLLTITASVLLAYLLAKVMIAPMSFSLGAVGAGNADDFTTTDMYHVIANQRDRRELSRDIVIVDIHNYNREQIASIIDVINLCSPKAVVLDVVFEEQTNDDSHIIEAISSTPHLVMPMMLEPDDNGRFKIQQKSFINPKPENVTYAAANYPSQKAGGTIRDMVNGFELSDGSFVPSMVAAVTEIADPEAYKALEKRGEKNKKNHEIINYPSVEFTVIDGMDLLERGEELTDKIVLVGSMSDVGDVHRTPIDQRMPGIKINAYALNMVLTGNYLYAVNPWVERLIAFIIALIFVYLDLTLSQGIKGISLRIVQLACLYVVLVIGFRFFIKSNIIIDFSQSFLMLAFALFSCDIIVGIISTVKWIKTKREKKRHASTPQKA